MSDFDSHKIYGITFFLFLCPKLKKELHKDDFQTFISCHWMGTRSPHCIKQNTSTVYILHLLNFVILIASV